MSVEVPKVTQDPEINEFVTRLCTRPEIIANKMREGGVDQEEIADHIIHYSAETGAEKTGEVVTFGNFDQSTLTSTVYLGSHQKIHSGFLERWHAEVGPSPATGAFYKILDVETNLLVNKTLLHETKHAIDMSVMGTDAYFDEQNSHFKNAYSRLNRNINIFNLVGAAATFGASYELYTAKSNTELFISFSAIGALVLGCAAGEHFIKRGANHWSKRHNVYLEIPGESRARQFADEQLATAEATNKFPVDIKFRRSTV